MAKTCLHCGKIVEDETANNCPNCGKSLNGVTGYNSTLVKIAFVFMIITCVMCVLNVSATYGLSAIPLAWTIPMAIKINNRSKNNMPLGNTFKVCVLLFSNIVAGILLLCDEEA